MVEQIICLLEYINQEDLKNRLNRIIEDFSIELNNFIGGQGITLLLGAYISDGKDISSKHCVDKARLAVLSIGKATVHQYQIYDEIINDNYKQQTIVLQRFNSALQNNEFEVFLQPKVDATTNNVIGAEALSRWFIDGTYLSPDTFIPILEINGLIEKLDLYVFENVMRFLHILILDDKEIVPISINISKKQNKVSDYVNKLDEIRRKYGVPTKYIEIEVTESSFVNNYDDAITAMRNLRELGYKISLDDFGTGYSNLEVLSTGLFDVVKFDKSLIKDIEDEKRSKILLYSIELARSLGLEIVCEGVETKSQRDTVVKYGGKIIQGFYYSKPISLYEFMNNYIK